MFARKAAVTFINLMPRPPDQELETSAVVGNWMGRASRGQTMKLFRSEIEAVAFAVLLFLIALAWLLLLGGCQVPLR